METWAAEGAISPESLRQKDRVGKATLEGEITRSPPTVQTA